MKQALFYRTKGNNVICELCPHSCVLKPDDVGECRTRTNKEGRLYTLAYGNPCALNIDPIEKKPLFHFLPGTQSLSISTAGCNLHCLNCQNYNISQVSPVDIENYHYSPEQLVQLAIDKNCPSISYTYTDPTVYYEYMQDIARLAHQNNIRNVMVSAGYINKEPLMQLCSFIDAANIDLKSFDDKIYKELSGVRLKPVLRTLKILKEQGVWLEITNLVVPGYTDDLVMVKRMFDWLLDNGFAETPIHFSRFIPTYQLSHLNATPVDTLFNIAEMAKDVGMQYVYVGNVHPNPYQNTVCKKCNKVLIERMGYSTVSNVRADGTCPYCDEKQSGVWE